MSRSRAWSVAVVMVVALGAACGDDGGHARPLDGGLDAGALDAGYVVLVDGALVNPTDGAVVDASLPPACSPSEQVIPVMLPAYHREGHIDYPDPPPVGGDHNPCWGKWGVYDESAPLAVEHWVHNLEHGGVAYLYNCPDGCSDVVAELKSFSKSHSMTIVTPYAALPQRFAVVAWGVRITSDCFDAPSFEAFYREHVNMGPELISSNPPDSCL